MTGVVAAFIAGAFTWSFLEYCIHRWLGHKHRRNPFAAEHIRHHSQGDYFAPAWKKVVVALMTTGVVLLPAAVIGGLSFGAAYTVGLVGFYLFYEVLHRRLHTHAGTPRYGRWVRRHHFYHHFVDPSKNHGVTSPVWDVLFGTYTRPGLILVPEKLKMRWLTGEDGEVRAPFATDYRLRRRHRV